MDDLDQPRIDLESAAADPVASTTLALLYVGQGHEDKALEVLESVLAADPFCGPALALLSRLERPQAKLEAHIQGDELNVAWAAAPRGAAVIIAMRFGSELTPLVTSQPCEGSRGRWVMSLPEGPAAVSLVLARLEDGHPRYLAVAEPLFW